MNIKPCPFCGSEHVRYCEITVMVYAVQCMACGATGAPRPAPYKAFENWELYIKEVAVAAWNRRARKGEGE